MKTAASILATVILLVAVASAQEQSKKQAGGDKPKAKSKSVEMEGAKEYVYKRKGDVELKMFVFEPADLKPGDKRPAIVFFFGGGWRAGTPTQFEQQCKYLASRGMVAMAADYRVLSRQGTPAVCCVQDAKSAVRWIRANAGMLGVDPDRLVASGGSAGGHIAACTGVVSGFDEPDEDLSVSSVPNAMALFNPALVLADIEGKPPLSKQLTASLEERMGRPPKELSPYHHVTSSAPPTIIFHGTADKAVPFESAQAFAEAMTKAGARCELVAFDGKEHGFFNYNRDGNKAFVETLIKLDKFLASLGYLEGPPTLKSE